MKTTHSRFGMFSSIFLILLVLVLACCTVPVTARATTQSTVLTRLNELRALAQRGLYFTTTGNACTDAESSECNAGKVIASGSAFRTNSGLTKWPSSFSMTHGRYNSDEPFTPVKNGWSCVGFANFAGWYLFADSASSSVGYYRLMDCQYKDVYRYALPGDIIASSSHSMVYISGDSSKITVLDCNYSHDCKIKERSISSTSSISTSKVTISRAYDYDLSDNEKFVQIAAEEGPDGHMYYLFSGRCPWATAEAYVANHFGSDYHLVTINSAEEQTFVANMVKTWNGAGHGGMAWTGAHYVNGSWEWSNGEAWSYSNFDSSSSGSTSTPYGIIAGQAGKTGGITYTAGKWYARSDLVQWAMPGFVVEYSPSSYSGSLGDVMGWELVNGVLSITGTGRMDSFSPGNSPWYGFRDQITTVEIGSGVINIGGNAFCDLINLTCVSMPDVDEINDCAFRGCASLESVTINAGYVGRYAFADCNILADLNITDECVVIDDYAFAYDIELQEVYIPDSVQQIGSYAFGPTYDGGMNPHLVIYCGEGSAAQQYAIDYGISYVITSDPIDPGTNDVITTRLNELRALAQRGLYFTTTGNACTDSTSSECNAGHVIASGSAFRTNSGLTKWPSSFSMTHGRYNSDSPFTTVVNGYSCVGFANFAGWYLFADSASSSVGYFRLMDCQLKDVYRYAVPGDIIASSTHSMVYISGNSSKITVLDCNYSGDCKIKEHTISSPGTTKVTISRAYGYDLSDDKKYIQIAAEQGPDGHMYYLYSGRCPWATAEAFVANHFGSDYHLVTINSAEEQAFVSNMVKTWNGTGHGGMAWTGAHYVNGSWEWSNGETWSYSNFDSSSSGSTTTPYGIIAGQAGKTGGITYTAGKWYARSDLVQWAMPGFVVEYAPSSCSEPCGEYATWELNDGQLYINGTGMMDNFIRGEAPWSEYSNQITSVIVDGEVLNVGMNAFADLVNLTSVSLHDYIEIFDYAFIGCTSLTSVTIPPAPVVYDNPCFVGGYAFAYCSSLTSVTIEEGCLIIGDYAFAYDEALTEIYIPESVIDFGTGIFALDANGNINPDLVIYCVEGSTAHQYAVDNGISFVFTGGLTNPEILASGAIGNLNWEVRYNPAIEYDTQLWFTGSGDLYYSNQAPWSEYIDSIDCVIMEFADITYIGSNTFRNHSNVKIVAPSENLQSMGQRVFENCASLEYIALPEHLNSIGAYAFSGCSSLEYITIPAELQEIQAHAFENCTGLVYAEITAASPVISDTAFDGCINMLIYCVKGNTAHQFAEEHGIPFVCIDCYFDSDFNPPASLKAIESEAFRGIPAIAVRLPDGISSIGNLAFAYCPNLINIYIPASCVTISNNAFEGCENLCIHAPKDSYAEYYANKHGFSFEVLNLD